MLFFCLKATAQNNPTKLSSKSNFVKHDYEKIFKKTYWNFMFRPSMSIQKGRYYKDDDFLLAPFTLRESRGVWKTKKGDLNSGSPYFVGADHEPQLLGVISNNEVTMEGEWDPRVGGIILLSELIGDTDYSELPARKKLIMILEGQANQ